MRYTDYESPQDILTKVVMFRLTTKEKQLLIEYAKKYQISMSALLRVMLSELTKQDLRFNKKFS